MPRSEFYLWGRSNAFFVAMAGTLGTLTATISACDKIWGTVGRIGVLQHPFTWIYAIQIALTLIALGWNKPWRHGYERIRLDQKLHDSARASLLRFRKWWLVLVAVWGITYVLYLAQTLLNDFQVAHTLPAACFTVLTKFEIAAYLGIYISLSSHKSNDGPEPSTWIFVGIVLFALLVLELVIEAIAGSSTYRGTVVTSISYSLLGITIAMVAGRLDSQRLTVHPSVLFCCYAFAAIQPMFPLASASFVLFLFSAALLLKTVFLIYVTYLVASGVLRKYVNSAVNVPRISPDP